MPLRSPPADTREGETCVHEETLDEITHNRHRHAVSAPTLEAPFIALHRTRCLICASSSYLLRVREHRLLPECPHAPVLGGPRAAADREPENGPGRGGDGAGCDVAHWRRVTFFFNLSLLGGVPGLALTSFFSFPSLSFATAERRLLQPSDCVYSESLTPQGKLVACRRNVTEILVCK